MARRSCLPVCVVTVRAVYGQRDGILGVQEIKLGYFACDSQAWGVRVSGGVCARCRVRV